MRGERERTGWIIRTVFVQLFVLCAQNNTQAQVLLHRFYLHTNDDSYSARHSDLFKKGSRDEKYSRSVIFYFNHHKAFQIIQLLCLRL